MGCWAHCAWWRCHGDVLLSLDHGSVGPCCCPSASRTGVCPPTSSGSHPGAGFGVGSQRGEGGVNGPAQHLGHPWRSPPSPALLLGRAMVAAERLCEGFPGGKGVGATDRVFQLSPRVLVLL